MAYSNDDFDPAANGDGFGLGADEFGTDPFSEGMPGAAGARRSIDERDRLRAGPLRPVAPPQAFPPRSAQEACDMHAYALQCALTSPYLSRHLSHLVAQALHTKFLHTAQPPWIEKPWRGEYFGGTIQMDVPADDAWYVFNAAGSGGAASSNSGLYFSQQVPPGHDGVMRMFGQDTREHAETAGDAAWDALHWQITKNGAPIDGFLDFQHQLCQIEEPHHWLTLPFREGERWGVRVRNSSAGVATAVCRVHGWIYPVRSRGDSAQERRDVT